MNSFFNGRMLIPVLLWVLGTGLSGPGSQAAEASIAATLYKNPTCQCCEAYASYLRPHGFEVKVIGSPDLNQFKREQGVPPELAACHTMLVEGYVIEGHVPVEVIFKLLRERPDIRGIALPGMGGEKQEPFTIYTITEGEPSVYTIH